MALRRDRPAARTVSSLRCTTTPCTRCATGAQSLRRRSTTTRRKGAQRVQCRKMTVGIVGLGLIGGSFAKAYAAGATVLAGTATQRARFRRDERRGRRRAHAGQCLRVRPLVLIALYPAKGDHDWFRRMAHIRIAPRGGRLRHEAHHLRRVLPIAKEHGVTFLGGHPMAGTQFSGFKNAKGGSVSWRADGHRAAGL